MNTGILSLYWTLSNICQYLTGGLWPAWCYQLKEPSKLINFCRFIYQIRKRSSCKNGLIFSCLSASFQEWKWSINTCEINKSVIKAVFNLGIKLVICGRDDFTCKEPLLLTLRALINEEYRDTCKGMCKGFVNWPILLHSISLHQHLLLILIRADAVNFRLYLRTPRYYELDSSWKVSST